MRRQNRVLLRTGQDRDGLGEFTVSRKSAVQVSILVIAVLPLLAVCLIRVVSSAVGGARRGGGLRGLRQGIADRLFEVSLAVAAGIGYVIVLIGRGVLSSAGGYHQQPVLYALDATRTWFWHSRVVVHGLLEMFGAYFVPGQDPQYPMTHLDQAIALTRLVTVVLAVWGACAIARRMFFRDANSSVSCCSRASSRTSSPTFRARSRPTPR